MNEAVDKELIGILAGILAILAVTHLLSRIFRDRLRSKGGDAFYANLSARLKAWWIMILTLCAAVFIGKFGLLVIFACISFQALREFLTMTPTARADHRALWWSFFFILPAQYLLLAIGLETLAWIFIPVYAFLFIPIRSALAEDTKDFLARTARTQWGLMVCIYFVSHVPALLLVKVPGYSGEMMKLVLFLLSIVQLSDVLQYVWGKSIGKTPISKELSPNKTAEGLIGGVLSTALVGSLLWWATPFSPLAAGVISLVICTMGFFGGLVMSAIKRDQGVKDFGSIIPGHGGVLDRIDSLCFAAPVFYRIFVYFYTV